MSALVLCSGGMDSVIAYYFKLTTQGDEPTHMLTIDYGQRHKAEIEKARHIFYLSKSQGFSPSGTFTSLNLDGIMPLVGSLMNPDIPVLKYRDVPVGPDPSFIPYRNLLFLSLAAQWAYELNAVELVTGLRGGFPDCTEEFELAVEKALRVSDPSYRLVVSSPVHRSRAESLHLALQLHGCWEALAHSMTCFEGTEPPCGQCLPCKKRAEGFAELGKPDPLLERINARYD